MKLRVQLVGETGLLWDEIEPERRKVLGGPHGLTKAFTHYVVIDGVTVYRSKTKAVVFGEGCSMTVTPSKGKTVDDIVKTLVTFPDYRPSPEAIVAHDHAVANGLAFFKS